MKKHEPEKLNSETPTWFKEWHDGEFWHFSYDQETRLKRVERLYWILFAALVAGVLVDKLL